MDHIFKMELGVENISFIDCDNKNNNTKKLIQAQTESYSNDYELQIFSKFHLGLRLATFDRLIQSREYTKLYKAMNNTLCNMKISAHGFDRREKDNVVHLLNGAMMMMFWSNYRKVLCLLDSIRRVSNIKRK